MSNLRMNISGFKKRPWLDRTADVQSIKTFFDYDDREITGVIRNLSKLRGFVAYKVSRLVALCAVDLLANSQPRVPVDTGELRESGRAHVELGGRGFVTVGKGQKDGTIEADLSGITVNRIKGAVWISANVQYTRWNEFGEDIALWCHETLLPYDSSGHPRARTWFTGPKYLELPFREKVNQYKKFIEGNLSDKVLAKDITRISRKRSKRNLGKFAVDQVELMENRMSRFGYEANIDLMRNF